VNTFICQIPSMRAGNPVAASTPFTRGVGKRGNNIVMKQGSAFMSNWMATGSGLSGTVKSKSVTWDSLDRMIRWLAHSGPRDTTNVCGTPPSRATLDQSSN